MLDHHVSNERYGTHQRDRSRRRGDRRGRALASSTSSGLPLNRDAAVCLYAALVCDTGRFQYDTTTPAVFELAAELVSFGVPVARLSRTLFEEHSFAYLKLLAAALDRAVLVPELSFVWTAVTQHDLERLRRHVRRGRGPHRRRAAHAARPRSRCVLKEGTDGITRVSMRSLGAVDVCRIAQSRGGGGHRFAAGFSTDEPIPETVRRIESALRE